MDLGAIGRGVTPVTDRSAALARNGYQTVRAASAMSERTDRHVGAGTRAPHLYGQDRLLTLLVEIAGGLFGADNERAALV